MALALATEGAELCESLEVWATDASVDALAVAGENLGDLATTDDAAASRVRLALGSWFDALPSRLAGRVDLVVCNPPYVAESEFPGLDPTVRDWEPRQALVAPPGAGGTAGMAAVEAVIGDARQWLSRFGSMVVEIAPSMAEASIDAARRSGFDQVRVERDLTGRIRMLVARC